MVWPGCSKRQDKLAEAEAMYREALAMRKKLLGNEHPDVATIAQWSGLVLHRQGKLARPSNVPRGVGDAQEAVGQRASGCGIISLNDLAVVLRREGKLAEAEQLINELLTSSPEGQPPSAALLRRASQLLRPERAVERGGRRSNQGRGIGSEERAVLAVIWRLCGWNSGIWMDMRVFARSR